MKKINRRTILQNKIKVAIIFGGRSAEHEVSIQSAKNVYNSLNKEKYEVILIGIDKSGKWYLTNTLKFLQSFSFTLPKFEDKKDEIALISQNHNNQLIDLSKNQNLGSVDIVFPVLHGPFGEDGTIQGMLKLMNIPFVGPSILGSAVSMDKDVMKRLLQQANIPIAKFITVYKSESVNWNYTKIIKELGLPFFVKPANLGSSVGVSKVKNENDFKKALLEAFQYDNKILIEQYIQGREIECSVLGNEDPIASLPGEVVVKKGEFYSYEAKYIDENGAILKIPAKLTKPTIKKVQELAIKAFTTLCCEGMSRVDFFLTKKGEIFVNELNTIPGFTNISMYPKLWEISGISFEQLVDKLIQLAIARFERDQKLKTSR